MDSNSIKNEFLNLIHNKVALSTFNTWFKDINFHLINNDIYLIVPHESYRNHLKNIYEDIIEDAILEINSDLNFIDITTKEDKRLEIKKETEDIVEIIDNNQNEEYKNYCNFNPKYTFDTYMVGESNRLAYSASMSVAEKPGSLYNPLFLYGNSGLGKTHLMHAIGNYIKQNSNKKVLYITSEQFVNDLILMYKNNGDNNISYIELFRKKYRDVDILMIDDIQFLETTTKSQQEFTNTFNSLYDNKKQIVICSDRSVDDLKLLEDRLKTRFNWGLKVNISPPNYELKVNIIKQKIKTSELVADFSDDIINYVASNCGSDVRNIEGFLTRLIAYQAIMNIPKLTLEDAIEALKEYTNSGLYTPNSIAKIQNCVAKYFNLSVDDLKGKKRNPIIANARHIAFFLCRMMTDESYVRIGIEFGNRNHATAIHSYEKIKKDMEIDKELGNTIIEIKSKISE